jgi:DNA-dependent RNA polymerase auxiliary subunit epsilon
MDKNKTHFSNLTLILVIFIFILSGLTSYLVYQNQTLKKINNNQNSVETKAVSVNLENDLEEITFLKTFGNITIFHTLTINSKDSTHREHLQRFYIADQNLSKKSVKEIFRMENNPAYNLNYIRQLYGKHSDYFIAQSEGAILDFAIFTEEGELITKSVQETNKETLKDWHVIFYRYNSDNESIDADLFSNIGEATIEIDPTTGKVIPNTFTKLPDPEN